MRRSDWDGLMAAGRKPARAHAQSFKASVVALEAISDAYTSIGGCFTSATGQSLPNCFVREMSVHHPIVDIRADIAGRRFGPISRHYLGTSIYDFGGQDVVSRQRPPDTLELKVPNGLHRYGVFHRHQNTGTDQNLARLGFVA
jgi:hypothetical protein